MGGERVSLSSYLASSDALTKVGSVEEVGGGKRA